MLAPLIIPGILTFNSSTVPIEYNGITKFIYVLLWITFYLILGQLLFESEEHDDTEMYWTILGLIGLSYLFLACTKISPKYLFSILLIMLLLAFSIYTELIFSDTIDDDSTNKLQRGYVHLMSPIFVLIFYLLVAIHQSKN
jgi:hypothetical protein